MMKKQLKVCECKRAYINPLSGICTLCWNEIYPKEQCVIEEDDLLKYKEETIEEAAEKWYDSTEENKGFPKIRAFYDGVKWQEEKRYSEEEVLTLIRKYQDTFGVADGNSSFVTNWFKKNKK